MSFDMQPAWGIVPSFWPLSSLFWQAHVFGPLRPVNALGSTGRGTTACALWSLCYRWSCRPPAGGPGWRGNPAIRRLQIFRFLSAPHLVTLRGGVLKS